MLNWFHPSLIRTPNLMVVQRALPPQRGAARSTDLVGHQWQDCYLALGKVLALMLMLVLGKAALLFVAGKVTTSFHSGPVC
jgi:hypothetical protein